MLKVGKNTLAEAFSFTGFRRDFVESTRRLSLVSTYVVCEGLSVKQVLAPVVEFLVQKSLNWDLVQNTPPPIKN